MLPIVWADEARVDLINIVGYVAQRDPSAAVRLGRAIEQSTWPLSEHPYLYQASERITGCREIVVSNNYTVVYRAASDAVLVLRVLHCRQQYP